MIAPPAQPSGPRHATLRGSREIAALFFFAKGAGHRMDCRARALRAWSPGDRVHVFPEGILLLLARPGRMDCDRAAGWPMEECGHGWSSRPLDEREVAAFGGAERTALVHRDGGVVAFAVDASSRADPAEWIDLSGWTIASPLPIGAPAPPPAPAHEVAVRPVHELLDAPQLAPADEVAQWLAGMQGARRRFSVRRFLASAKAAAARLAMALRGHPAEHGGAGRRGAGAKPGGSTGARILGFLHSLFTRRRAAGGTMTDPAGESTRTSILGRLGTALGGALFTMGLAAVVGRRFAAYLNDLIRRLDSGNVDDALRRAIPLQGPGGTGVLPGGISWFPSFLFGLFGSFGPLRKSLSLSTTSSKTRALAIAGLFKFDLHDLLRRRYMAMHERLDAEGRWKEAAFVLAQLLNDIPAAVAYLERRDQYALAAELAEGRKAPPPIVVRAWFLAGQPIRAIDYALRHDAIGVAIVALDRDRKAEANKLRLLWAGMLAEAGRYQEAADVVEPVREARQLRKRWLDLLIDLGGEVGARMLAKRILSSPEDFDALRPHVERFVDPRNADSRIARATLAAELANRSFSRQNEVALRIVHRALLRDIASSRRPVPGQILGVCRQLAGKLDNAVLRGDIPDPVALFGVEPEAPPLGQRETPVEVEIRGGGSMPAFDAVRVAHGQWLVALGEAGARLLDGGGRKRHAFPVTAHEFVVSTSAASVLAVGHRGAYCTLSRIDVAARSVHHLPDMALRRWSRTFDGIFWAVATHDTVSLLRLNRPGGPETCWQHRFERGHILGVANDRWKTTVLLGLDDGLYVQRFNFAADDGTRDFRRLRFDERDLGRVDAIGFGPNRVILAGAAATPGAGIRIAEVDLFATSHEKLFGPVGAKSLEPVVGETWHAIPATDDGDMLVHVLDCHPRLEGKVRGIVRLRKAGGVSVRPGLSGMTVADDTGRVLEFDFAQGLDLVTRIDLSP